ncbi:uncharacterized protein RHIMIDRAFT_242987 [Rhizopus microsporus ATCC 52813]|uniref:Uncharacterized protein n=1 Tax=Rhizopus microsporus ATCC 52813 TaxID=1340429 RepID=A0A2G4SEA2_RHIZD|nr:uncharacterized protein RHIMIDRAFT_242987 [Rhizopus microsporus ATCC 52813]PHZ07163.1 hypothetical protein RHIMIDRAFT_242987 [Rhizopus microsporus ATCC 52813]
MSTPISLSASPVIVIEDFDFEIEAMEGHEANAIVISSSDDEFVMSNSDGETNDEEVIAMNELDVEINETFWSLEVQVPIPTARHFYSVITPTPEVTFNFLMNSGVYYGTREDIGTCPGGSLFSLRSAGQRGMVWRCNGILDLTIGIRCCQGTMVSPRLNSFFAMEWVWGKERHPQLDDR